MQTFPTPFRSEAERSEAQRGAWSRGSVPPSGANASTHDRGRSTPRPRRYHPGVLAALCYAVPIVPGVLILWRERDNRFVRFHAAHSLVFFALVGVGQIGLYTVLVVAGGLIASDLVATVAAAVIVLLFVALGVGALFIWFGLLADCISGRTRPLPLAGVWAERLERITQRRVC